MRASICRIVCPKKIYTLGGQILSQVLNIYVSQVGRQHPRRVQSVRIRVSSEDGGSGSGANGDGAPNPGAAPRAGVAP